MLTAVRRWLRDRLDQLGPQLRRTRSYQRGSGVGWWLHQRNAAALMRLEYGKAFTRHQKLRDGEWGPR